DQIGNSRVSTNFSYCEILVNNAAPLLSVKNGRFRMSFVTLTQLKSDSFETAETLGKFDEKLRCDPFRREFKNETFEDGKIIKLEIKDFLSPKLLCSAVHPNSLLYAELRERSTSQRTDPIRVKRVECKKKSEQHGWKYEILKLDGGTHDIPHDANFEVFCGVPVELMCKDPNIIATHPPVFEQDIETMQVSLK
ncbi:hypothetical protein PMAYCL1PPCAC_03766, partial [Pristionchus mayeri]